MLIKFGKQIGKILVKINNANVNQDPAKQLRWSFFRNSFLGLQWDSGSCQTSKIVKSEKPFTTSELAFKVTNVPFAKQFEYQRSNNRLAKTKKKEPAELLN